MTTIKAKDVTPYQRIRVEDRIEFKVGYRMEKDDNTIDLFERTPLRDDPKCQIGATCPMDAEVEVVE